MLLALKIIFAFLAYFLILHYGFQNGCKDIVAWREGKYVVSVMWFLLYMLKAAVFSFLAPLVLVWLIFK